MTVPSSRRQFFKFGLGLPLAGSGLIACGSSSWASQAPVPLDEKSARRDLLNEKLERADDNLDEQNLVAEFIKANYAATPTGKFTNIDKLFLRWAKPDWFEYVPDDKAAFSFTRSNGEVLTPGGMFTDGGSIPRVFWLNRNLSPWVYVPAFLVHDWEFDQHRAKASAKAFDDVRDTLAEGLKTMMEMGAGPRSEKTFRTIYAGVSSSIAKEIWAS